MIIVIGDYSIDNVTIDFVVKKIYLDDFMKHLSVMPAVEQWIGRAMSICRYNYTVSCSESSYTVGISPNWIKGNRDVDIVRLDYNPNKVKSEILPVLGQLGNLATSICIKRMDLAIDYRIKRRDMYLVKDKRQYRNIVNSIEDRTEYLGKRNNHGSVKLYNKTIEAKLEYDLTRLEITFDFDKKNEVNGYYPNYIYIPESIQLEIDTKLSGTDRVLLLACLDNPDYISMLEPRKQKKIRSIIGSYSPNLEFDNKLFNCAVNDYLNIFNDNTLKLVNQLENVNHSTLSVEDEKAVNDFRNKVKTDREQETGI